MSSIHDLARELGVSISTVSRALAGKSNVTEATRRRVMDAAARLGYAPNRSGRSLRSGATSTVTFLMTPHPQLLYSDSFFLPLLDGAHEALARHGLDLVVALGRSGDAQVEQVRHLVESRSTDAILLAWTRAHDERIAYLAESGFPFAAIGRSLSGGAFPSLDIDFDDIGARAARRLIARGHRRVALVNTAPDLMFHEFLEAGYRRALEEAGIEFDPVLARDDPMTEAEGRAVVADLLALPRPPTALIVCGEIALAAAWRALGDAGVRIGEDVAIVATSDTPICAYLQPTLTRFRPRLRDMGARLGEILFHAMPSGDGAVLQEVVRLDLVEGESDAKARV